MEWLIFKSGFEKIKFVSMFNLLSFCICICLYCNSPICRHFGKARWFHYQRKISSLVHIAKTTNHVQELFVLDDRVQYIVDYSDLNQSNPIVEPCRNCCPNPILNDRC